MLIYKDQKTVVRSEEAMHEMQRLLSSLSLELNASTAEALEISRELLIYAGMFESGLCDHLFGSDDSVTLLSNCMRNFMVSLGRLHVSLWQSGFASTTLALRNFHDLRKHSLPASITLSVPEGYAFYGLFPETYIEAANDFAGTNVSKNTVCIGIRSIGTSLSAVVAGALQDSEWQVQSFTVRPRGEPFDRKVSLSVELKNLIDQHRGSYFLIVDEGPGLSGSSLASVAQCLKSLGVASNRIIFFPGSDADSTNFVNETAKSIWNHHRKCIRPFETVFYQDDRLIIFPDYQAVDLSAGKWRSFNESGSRIPVNPHHERRKYLLIPNGTPVSERNTRQNYLAKFIGFKPLSKDKLIMSDELGLSGFTLPSVDFKSGFILYNFVEGKPLDRPLPSGALETFARYCSIRRNMLATAASVPFDLLMQMMLRNVDLGLGTEWRERLELCKFPVEEILKQEVCAVDGRMMPYEWILISNGKLIKTDSIDHFCDQFVPGRQDIAWDLAGLFIEFDLNSMEASELISFYKKFSGDDSIVKRLPFYMIAYLSFRLGYVTLSAESMRGTQDGLLFDEMRNKYAGILKVAISEVPKRSGVMQARADSV